MTSITGFEASSSRIVIYRPRVAGFALFAILCLSIIGLEPLSGGTKPIPFTGAGDVFRQLAYFCVFGLAFVGLRVVQNLRQVFVFSISLCILLAWCWLSLAWAIEPSIAIRRLILTTMLMWLIFLCVEHAGFELTTDMARAVLIITLVLNYIAVAISPIAVHQIADVADPNLVGNWRGVMAQKNFAGAVSALLIIFCLFGDTVKRPWVRWLIALAAAYFLYRSSSKTSMGILAPAIAVGWIYFAFGAKYRRILIPAIALLAGIAILMLQGDNNPLAAIFNRPDGLTGRVQIWPVLLAYSSDHPWFGSGFGSFWNIGSDSPVFWYSRTWVSEIANGHNGYL
ncbi:MAG: O-antigen ligase family protein, partial [Thermomicrobiales bacterium]